MRKNLKYYLISLLFIVGYYLIKNIDDIWMNIRMDMKYNKWQTVGFEGQLEKGLKQGEWKNYYTNGILAKVENYKNDTLNGVRIGYTPDGELKVTEKYKMGIKVDTFKFFVSGRLNLIEFRDSLGLTQGEFKVYTSEGLNQIGHKRNNKFHGDFVMFYPKTGTVRRRYQYENGEKSGKWIYFDELGDTVKIETHE